jgi:hypothetical protein
VIIETNNERDEMKEATYKQERVIRAIAEQAKAATVLAGLEFDPEALKDLAHGALSLRSSTGITPSIVRLAIRAGIGDLDDDTFQRAVDCGVVEWLRDASKDGF